MWCQDLDWGSATRHLDFRRSRQPLIVNWVLMSTSKNWMTKVIKEPPAFKWYNLVLVSGTSWLPASGYWWRSSSRMLVFLWTRWRCLSNSPLVGNINRQRIHGTKWVRLWRAFSSLLLKIEQQKPQGWDTGWLSIFADVQWKLRPKKLGWLWSPLGDKLFFDLIRY